VLSSFSHRNVSPLIDITIEFFVALAEIARKRLFVGVEAKKRGVR
jgi:hypothetical protein